MSSRQLRKLERQQLEESPENGSEEDVETRPVKAFNAFDFLEDGEEEEDEQDENQVQASDGTDPDSKEINKDKNEDSSKDSTKKKSKSKSKKSKKAKKKEPENSDDELDKILQDAVSKDKAKFNNSEGKEIEDSLLAGVFDFEQEYNENMDPMWNYDSNYKNFTTERLKQSLSLLSIGSVKNLDPDEELKSLFGNLSLETIEDANTTTSLAISPEVLKQFKRLARLTKGWGGKDKRSVPGSTRKLLLTRIKDDYLPTSQKPLQMEELTALAILDYIDYKEDVAEIEELQLKIKKELDLGVKYFRFKKNNTIQERVATTQFYASVVLSPDHDALISLLRNYPYHAETLLQVSMVILRQGNDKSTSNALIEKCLFVFDRCFHVFFHDLLSEAKTGLIRLPYEAFMNRQFYLCLFRYIVSLGERATFFTSFNYCIFLLSLNPSEDPIGVRYFIDFYAIMSQEYKYLTKFAKSPLVTAYSKWLTPGIAFSTVLAYLNMNESDNAKEALKRAFVAHPYTAYRLLEEIGLPSKMPISESSLFVDDEILLATDSYMVRAKTLWNSSESRKFLSDELCKLFVSDKAQLHNHQGTNGGFASSVSNFFSSLGKQPQHKASTELPFNLIRFAILSGENSLMAKIPQSIWSRDDVFEFDPLPPKNTSLGYSATGGIEQGTQIVDGALDYVDQNVLGSIIQNRTQTDEFDDIVRQLQNTEE